MIKAVLFDMDGVLVDSEDLSISIGIKYFESRGYKAERKNFLSHLGTGMSDFIYGTASEIGAEVSVEDADRFYQEAYAKELENTVIAMPGAETVLHNIKNMGIKMAICSSAQRWKVNANIKALGVDPGFFDLVIAEDMIKRNKSNPDIYLLAIASLGVDRNDAIVFEDSRGGVLAGVNAGIRTVALTTTMTRDEAEHSMADRVIRDIKELEGIKDAKALEDCLFPPRNRSLLYGASYIMASGEPIRPEIINKCIKEAIEVRKSAYAPYSKYKVGAALLSAGTGLIYRGSNIENSSYGATICAERNAVTTAVSAEGGELGIDLIAIASEDSPPAPPCALCLQVIAEFSRPETEIILVGEGNVELRYLLRDLLPKPFVFPTMRKQ